MFELDTAKCTKTPLGITSKRSFGLSRVHFLPAAPQTVRRSLLFWGADMKLRFLLLVLVVVSQSCSLGVRAFKHSPDAAGKEAEKFAFLAFVKHDFQNALLKLVGQSFGSEMKLKEIVGKMHPTGYPDAVVATEFEPIPGQRAMNIFLVGENNSEQFYYRFTMAGTAETGYRVSGLWRGSGPYPPSKRRRSLEHKSVTEN